MKKISLFVAMSFLAANTFVSSCKKDKDTTPSDAITDTQVADAQDQSIAASAYDDVDAEVEAATATKLKSSEADDTASAPVTKTVKFEKGKITKELMFDGKSRNGKAKTGSIIVEITYPTAGDTTTGWKKTITFNNYTVGGRKIEGTKTIVYKGFVNGSPTWDITLVGGKVTFKNGKTITCDYTRTRTMLEGFNTRGASDNVFEINGSSSGVTRKGVEYKTTSTNLVRTGLCPHFKSGTVTYTSDNKTVKITYNGGNSCSASAIIEVNGKTKTIDTDNEQD